MALLSAKNQKTPYQRCKPASGWKYVVKMFSFEADKMD